jgi:hypothetical protein
LQADRLEDGIEALERAAFRGLRRVHVREVRRDGVHAHAFGAEAGSRNFECTKDAQHGL